MNFQEPDDMVAMMELEFQIYEEYVGESLTVGYEFAKLSQKEKDRALNRNAEIMIIAAEKAGHDVIRDIPDYWEVAPGVPAFLWLPDLKDRVEQIRLIKKLSGDEYFLQCFVAGFIGIPDGRYIDEFVNQLYEEPERLHKHAKQMLESSIETQKYYIEAGADGLGTCADIAFKTGTFLSPAQLDEFFFPYFIPWVESVHKEGLLSIWHTDGNLNAVIDKIIASGVSALQCIDPLADMNIVEIKKKAYGKMALIGNLDCAVLYNGSKESIMENSRKILNSCKTGGGFAFGGCNAIFKGITAENYQAMVDARYLYGKTQS